MPEPLARPHQSSRIVRGAIICLFASSSLVGQTKHRFDSQASGRIDEIARRPESRIPEVSGPRAIHEAERPHRARNRKALLSIRPREEEAPPPAASGINPGYGGFPALLDNFTAIPPDTNGAIGPQHVVTMLNTQMQIQSRTAVIRANYPISLNAFWSPLGSFTDTFDPRILYDAASDRWIACSALNGQSANSALLLAATQTGDPGGAWNMFKINVGPNNWGDYPVLGFNGNWVVVSLNLFSVKGDSYQGTKLYVFKKTDLFQNGNNFITFNDDQGELIPALDYDNRPNTMYFVQAFGDPGTGTVRISRLQGPIGSESFKGGNVGEISVPDTWNGSGPGNSDFGPQAGSTTQIDSGDDRLQNCAIRGGTIWCAHTIFLPQGTPTRAAVQWFQLDPATLKILQKGRIDDSSGSNFYAYPSIAVNRNNDVLIGYTHFSTTDYASAAFSFRTANDPPNTLQPEVIYKHGENPYISPGARSGSNRWGDYSVTWVDPTDDLTFWTLQEYASTPPQNQKGRFGTFWAQVTAPSSGQNCTYNVSPLSQAVGNAGAAGNVAVGTTAGCRWMAASDVPWITLGAGTPGIGGGALAYVVAPNTTTTGDRIGTITVAGQSFTITQGSAASGPDLAVTAATGPTAVEAGASATVATTVVNQGAAAAGAFRIGLYLGPGPTIASRDFLLASCNVSGLAVNGSTNCSRTVVFPAGIQPGTYVIGVIADDQNQAPDTDRSNNTRMADSGPVAITASAQRPIFTAEAVVNAASYQGGGVAPGEVVAVFGSNLGPDSFQTPIVSPDGVVDTIAGGTRLLFDGVPSAMIAASKGLITAVAPFGIQGHATTQLQVEYFGTRSDPITLPVLAVLPAIFTQDASGKGQGSALNDDFSVNKIGNGAAPGSTISIYATGGGYMAAVADGVLPQPPYAQLTQVSARIGGLPAQVTYAGVAPGIITGVLQINVVVPAGAPAGNAVPIELSFGGATTQAGVTVAIK